MISYKICFPLFLNISSTNHEEDSSVILQSLMLSHIYCGCILIGWDVKIFSDLLRYMNVRTIMNL